MICGLMRLSTKGVESKRILKYRFFKIIKIKRSLPHRAKTLNPNKEVEKHLNRG
jgi:hypothetical protein